MPGGESGPSAFRVSSKAGVVIAVLVLAACVAACSRFEPVSLTREERQWIASHGGKVRFAPSSAYAPICFRDDPGGFAGVTMDYVALLEERLGIHFRLIETRDISQIMALAENGGVDLVGNVRETEERKRFLRFTEPYIEIPTAVIVRARGGISPADGFSGKRVAVVPKGGLSLILKKRYPEAVMVPVRDSEEGLRKVSLGEADAIVTNLAVASYGIERLGISNLRVAGELAGHSSRLAFATQRSDPVLFGIITKGLESISEAEADAIYRRWIAIRSSVPIWRDWRFYVGLFLSLGFAYLVASVWMESLRKEVARRTQALRESEERLGLLAEVSFSGVAVHRGGVLLEANDQYYEMFGYRPGELLGKNVIPLTVAPEMRDMHGNRDCLDQPDPMESVGMRKDGSTFPMELRSRRVSCRGEGVVGTVVTDITERKRQEEEQLALKERLQSLWNVASMTEAGVDELCDLILAEILSLTKSEHSFFGFIDEAGQMLLVHAWSPGAMATCAVRAGSMRFPVENGGVWTEAVHSGKPLIINEYEDRREANLGLPEGHVPLTRLLAVPCLREGRAYALAAVANKETGYTEEDVRQVEAFVASVMLLVDRRRVVEELRKNEERMALAFDAVSDAVWDLRRDAGQAYLSPRGYAMLGYEPHEFAFALENWLGMTHPEDADRVRKTLDHHWETGEYYQDEYRIRTRGGGWRWILSRGNVVERDEEGRPLRMLGTHVDISDKKRLEAGLRRREHDLKQSQAIAALGSWHLDLLSGAMVWTGELRRMYGLSSGAYPLHFTELGRLFTPEDGARLSESLLRTITTGEPHELELRIADGHLAPGWMWVRGEAEFNDAGSVVGLWGAFQDITARKELELERKRKDETYQDILDNLSAGVVVHGPDGTVLVANPAACGLLGTTPEKFVGRKAVFGPDLSFAHEDGSEMGYEELPMRRVAASGKTERNMVIGVRRSGHETVWILANAFPAYEEGRLERIIVSFVEISDLKRASEELRESEIRYKFLHEASRGGIAIHDGGIIRDCNQGLCEITDHAMNELIGMDIMRLIAARSHDDVRKKVLSGYEGGYEVFGRRRDGSEYPLRIEGRNIPYKGKTVRSVEFRDVTESRRAERALIRAKEAAEAASRAKSEFLANMSHEIRTPLNGLMGMLQLLEASGPRPEQARVIDMALFSGERLTRLLTDVLDISTIEAGKLALTPTTVDVRDLVDSVTSLLWATARQEPVALSVTVAPDVPARIEGDEVRLRQILLNLVGNGLKFTGRGTVSLEVAALPADNGRGGLLLTVSDTGPGMGDAQLATAFEMFGQVSRGFTRSHQGAGLGLPIVKRIVDLMGGTLCVDTELGRGADFYVSLPLQPAPLPPLDEESEVRTAPVPAGEEGTRILLVEDEPASVFALTRLLDRHGYAVTAVGDGRQALQALREGAYRAVLMDIQMPVMDGVEATRRIRGGEAGERNRSLPIIALTAYALGGDEAQFRREGMDGYVAKPVSLEKLLAQLAGVLEN